MKRIIALLFLGIFTFTLTACSSTGESAVNQVSEAGREIQSEANSNVLIAYYNGESGDSVKNAASLLEETVGGDMFSIGESADKDFSKYEFILLGFAGENSTLPDAIQSFLSDMILEQKLYSPLYQVKRMIRA